MTEVITYKPLLAQHGRSTTGGTIWAEVATNLGDFPEGNQTIISAGEVYGFVFDFEIDFDSTTGLPRPSRNYFTQDSQSQYLEILFSTNIETPVSTFGYQFRATSTPELWGLNTPPQTNTDLQDIETTFSNTSDIWTLNGSTYDMVFQIDFNTKYGSGKDKNSIQRYIQHSTWNGYLAIVITNTGGASYRVNQPTGAVFDRSQATGQYVDFYTGWLDRPASRGRPVTDMKTGLPAFAEDLVEDGFLPGIWTSADQWDPIDPRDIRSVEFPDDEGVKKDEVPV